MNSQVGKGGSFLTISAVGERASGHDSLEPNFNGPNDWACHSTMTGELPALRLCLNLFAAAAVLNINAQTNYPYDSPLLE